MRFRHKSASLMLTVEKPDQIEIYRLASRRPGNGHAGELLRSVVAMFPGKWISLTVGPFGDAWMDENQLRAFYGRCGFVADPRPDYPTHMWIYP